MTQAQWRGESAPGGPGRRRSSTRARPSTRCRAARRSSRRFDADTSAARDRLRRTAAGRANTSRCRASAPTSSGGVVDLDRDYGGVGARADHRRAASRTAARRSRSAPTATACTSSAQGFVNNNGAHRATLRRDEDDTVTSGDVYAEVQWTRCRALSLTLGVRSSHVRYESVDHYIVGPNPDDSGRARTTTRSPIAGIVWHATRRPQRLRELRSGIRDADVRRARLPARGPRPQLRARSRDVHRRSRSASSGCHRREPARQSRGVRRPTRTRRSSIDTATGGRTTYRNASKTRRRGFEAEWDGDLGGGFTAHVNYTYLAEFAEAYLSGLPPRRRRPPARGCPACRRNRRTACSNGRQAVRRVQRRRGGPVRRAHLRQRPQHRLRAGVHDRQRRASGFAQAAGNACSLASTFASTTSPTCNYVGSVIVGDTNGRYFEPAPGRNWFAGVSVNAAF